MLRHSCTFHYSHGFSYSVVPLAYHSLSPPVLCVIYLPAGGASVARWGAGGAYLCVQPALQNWREEEEGKGHAVLLAL